MDFIEKLFGLSPDNGDGSTEILWLVVLAVVTDRKPQGRLKAPLPT